MVYELICVMWAVVWDLGFCVVCGLLYDICVLEYVGCCMACGLLYSMWAFVCYVGCFMVCGLLYGMWVVV